MVITVISLIMWQMYNSKALDTKMTNIWPFREMNANGWHGLNRLFWSSK